MNLENKRLQFVAQWLTPAFAFIVAIITISNSLGLERTLYLGVIVALVGWIIANQLVQRATPKKSPTLEGLTEFQREHTYGCLYCGEPKILLPPDSHFVFLQVEPCEFDDARPIIWTCSNCRKINGRYWDRDHSEAREYRRKAP